MKKVLIEYIIKNKKNFLIIAIIFILGVSLGIIFINASDNFQKDELNNYVNALIKNIKETDNISKIDLLFLSIKQNVCFILLVWFLGCTIIGGLFIYVTILYKGFAIGYTISSIIAVLGIKNGIIFSCLSLLLQNLIFIPAFFILAENGIKLYRGIYKRCINLKEEVIRHTIIMFISIMLILISSFVEVYISTNLLIFLKEIL